jgi:hypothetical protein
MQVSNDMQSTDSAPSTVIFEKSEEIQTSVACLNLTPNKSLKLIGADESLVAIVRSVIQESWKKGIARENKNGGNIEFELNGKAFDEDSEEYEDSYQVTRLVSCILSRLYNDNWV